MRIALALACLALLALPCAAAAPLHLVEEHEVDLPASPVAALARPGSDEVWVSLSDGSLAVLAGRPLHVIGRVEDIGTGCWGLAFGPKGERLYGTDWMGYHLVEVNPDSRKIVRKLAVGLKPAFLALTPDGRTAYITNYLSGELSIVDLEGWELTGEVDVGQRPMGVVLSPGGERVYVASGVAGKVSVVDLESGEKVDEIDAPFSTTANLVLHPAGDRLLAAGLPSHLISLGLSGEVAKVKVGRDPIGVVLSPEGGHAFVTNHQANSVSVVDLEAAERVQTSLVGKGPMFPSLSPDGRRLYVCNSRSQSLSILQVADGPPPEPVVPAPGAGEAPGAGG
jgi:YVTN family beta-propeller protein